MNAREKRVAHRNKRFLERFGIQFSTMIKAEIAKSIRNKQFVRLKPNSTYPNSARLLINFRGKRTIVIIHTKSGEFLTIYPMNS